MRRLLLLLAAVAVPCAGAGTAEAPEVADPLGDVAAYGAPVPAALAWGDLAAAWFAHQDGVLRLTIQVGGDGPPPQGEVGVTFRAGGEHFIAGYTVVPGLYSGGFLSRSDEAGDVPSGVTPGSVDGSWSGRTITVTFQVADLAGAENATSLSEPWGWSESRATNGETHRLDRTDVGLDFVWGAGEETGGTPAGPSGNGARESPGLPATGLLALLGATAMRRLADRGRAR